LLIIVFFSLSCVTPAGEDLVSKQASEMETGQGQLVVGKRVRQRWPKEQRRRERDEGPIEMSKWRRRRRRGGENRSAHTGTR